MPRCSVPTCGGEGDEEYDEDGNLITSRPHPRFHKRCVFDPPRSACCFSGIKRWWRMVPGFLSRLYTDPYYFSIVRAVALFSIGLKLFHDMYWMLQEMCESEKSKACRDPRRNSYVRMDMPRCSESI
ncbi:hypothetical protein O0L34_g788 [Tuta absoluta]|nr:hypothetical protein O0L34_g3389 [Tuta absoluta]KAJ2953211.1 hypothetical protein O0L34_g788 [Tuta absoluta]